MINDAPDNLIPEGTSEGIEYAADVLDYAEEVFDGDDQEEVYIHRFVGIPSSSEEEARKMMDIFNKGIQDTTGHDPVLYQRKVTYGEWTRVDG